MDTALDFAEGKILVRIADGVGRVVFNQPEKRNAMSIAMWEGLGQAVDRLSAEDAVRVIVLEGAGDKAFVSGADISQFERQRSDAEAQRDYERITSGGRARLAQCRKPIIAKIRGFCLGGGLALAMTADLRIAAEDATFGIPAARLGLAYGFQSVRTLTALVGPAHARMMLFSGERIDAREAERIGLVNRVVADDQLEAETMKLAQELANGPRVAWRYMKRNMKIAEEGTLAEALESEAIGMMRCRQTDDHREALRAFMARRRAEGGAPMN